MAVFAHFIYQLGHQQSRLLALRRKSGAHSGENLAGSLVDIVHEWEIEGRQLDLSMRPVDIKARRMRCYGHTLNLVAQAFLFGKDADSFELESDINSMRGLIEQGLDHWRTKGPIGKLRNVVKFIRSSPQRSEQFKRIAREQDYEGYRLCEESRAELEVVMNN
ncbi:transposase [Fusarium beomiforme]|uniref:Transposase n=1 Tax=Fusarium beomiforme TaxID=44412 RepID=A0A9P5AN14_9HYPO|nr:transposase [Fusarium beomiforme]